MPHVSCKKLLNNGWILRASPTGNSVAVQPFLHIKKEHSYQGKKDKK